MAHEFFYCPRHAVDNLIFGSILLACCLSCYTLVACKLCLKKQRELSGWLYQLQSLSNSMYICMQIHFTKKPNKYNSTNSKLSKYKLILDPPHFSSTWVSNTITLTERRISTKVTYGVCPSLLQITVQKQRRLICRVCCALSNYLGMMAVWVVGLFGS